MPKTPFKIEALSFTLRLPIELSAWVNAEAKRTGSFNQAIREVLEDARTFFGLPDVLKDELEAERAELGKSRREYIVHVLSLHAAELLKARSTKRKR